MEVFIFSPNNVKKKKSEQNLVSDLAGGMPGCRKLGLIAIK